MFNQKVNIESFIILIQMIIHSECKILNFELEIETLDQTLTIIILSDFFIRLLEKLFLGLSHLCGPRLPVANKGRRGRFRLYV